MEGGREGGRDGRRKRGREEERYGGMRRRREGGNVWRDGEEGEIGVVKGWRNKQGERGKEKDQMKSGKECKDALIKDEGRVKELF